MSSTPNTNTENKHTNGSTSEAASTSIHIHGTLNYIYKHDQNDVAEIDPEEPFIFSSSDFDACNDGEDIILETHLQPVADYQFIVLHDAARDNNISERIMSSTPKANFVSGNNVSVVNLNSSDEYDVQSVDQKRFSKSCSLEVTGAPFDENVSNGQYDEGDNEGVFFSDDDEIVINFLGKANHIVRLILFLSCLVKAFVNLQVV